MSQLQFWVAIAAPSILFLIGILLDQRGLHRPEERLGRCIERLEQQMDEMTSPGNREFKDRLR